MSSNLTAQAKQSVSVRKAVYAELKERREKLIERKYKQGRSMLAVTTEVAMLTDVEVLEELNYGNRNTIDERVE